MFPLVLGIIIMLIGIWHPYVVDISPTTAAALGSICGVLGMVSISLGVEHD